MILYGKNLILYGNKNGTLIPLCGSRACNVTINAEEKNATKEPESIWKSVYYGELSYNITASGMCILDATKLTHRDLINMQINREFLTWVCKNRDNDQDFLSGKVMISSISIDGAMDDLQMYSFSGVGDGEIGNENPYEVMILGNDNKGLLGDDGAAIGYVKTGGNLPINDNC